MLAPECIPWIPPREVRRAQDWVHRWGYGVVGINRFLTGACSVIVLAVGMGQLDARKTTFYATLSAILWTSLIVYFGHALGENWRMDIGYLDLYGRVVVGLLILALFGYLGRCYGQYGKERSRKSA